MGTILVVDPDGYFSTDISIFLSSLGHSMFQSSDLHTALLRLDEHRFDAVIGNVSLPGGEILQLVREAKKRNNSTAVIIITEAETVKEGLQAVQEGAFSFLQKPFSLPELNFQIRRALQGIQDQKGAASEPADEIHRPYNILGESESIKKVFKMVSRVAKANISVMILGETGTGKELVAGAIHYNSPRADGPFVRMNCAALPEPLLESELFGYEKGAFTGADKMRVGRFEHADGGTIFLDEVADMSLLTQAKVLRVIQEKEFERVGSNEPRKTDVRIISATNKDIFQLMKAGSFREDLFYRLNVVTIRIPPLRERDGDIGILIQFFLKRASSEMNKAIRGIETEALRILENYHWPGNIRELENTIERAVLMADEEMITAEDLHMFFAGQIRSDEEGGVRLPDAGISLAEAERQLIEQALIRCGWVQRRAAALLGISSRVMNYKIKMLMKAGQLRMP
jgi:DNA-binding NtrC family response regulator